MLALIAGTGALPGLICERLRIEGQKPLVCEMRGFTPDLPEDLPRLPFRLETFGTLLATLKGYGVTRVCMAGAVRRPPVEPDAIDEATQPLVPRLKAALARGDDGTLREFVAIFEEARIEVVGAHEIVPELLPPAGLYAGETLTSGIRADAELGEGVVRTLGEADLGQACAVRNGRVLAQEGPEGTAAMLASLSLSPEPGGLLFKAPKPGQERRVDLPAIGPYTVTSVAEAGLTGIVLAAGGVMVIGLEEVVRRCNERGILFWIRAAGES
ncbi:LpxI family protein [Pelagovum pacificum]|uniref:LpxI family protein n=1 Tax=Pelagovum pacificum TaxID=2588711 RepID=A0A5C5GCF0_9RHOB|nr:UDP-2,3-diacylglucosamine diphosphatase LpxI [Pelagovum pacificum]QQA44547.1 UDP-2,3-diacylglucosamine diphosphatase LpxI [Pelagovum pacificum]TNY32338.1 LpxI family protein [Pelagovum pacificum]